MSKNIFWIKLVTRRISKQIYGLKKKKNITYMLINILSTMIF